MTLPVKAAAPASRSMRTLPARRLTLPTRVPSQARALGPLDGTVFTIKDLFDVEGEVTRAGSRVLASRGKPAAKDAVIVKRLRDAGAVIVAKTNMTEFAYSGPRRQSAFRHAGQPGGPFAGAGWFVCGGRRRGG